MSLIHSIPIPKPTRAFRVNTVSLNPKDYSLKQVKMKTAVNNWNSENLSKLHALLTAVPYLPAVPHR